MNRCDYCGYSWADLDEDGVPISREYCHYDGPENWAPCELDDKPADELYGWEEEYE